MAPCRELTSIELVHFFGTAANPAFPGFETDPFGFGIPNGLAWMLGAKSWQFIGRESAGRQSAVIHTLIENVRSAEHDAETYPHRVFERLPGTTNQNDQRALLPAA